MASPDLSVHKINRGVALLRACQGCVRFLATTTRRQRDFPVGEFMRKRKNFARVFVESC